MPHETITFHRAELYEAVWAEPVRIVARRLGISDVALGKICRKLRVPTPGLGYWARKAVGQEIEPVPLPPLRDGDLEEWKLALRTPSEDSVEQVARRVVRGDKPDAPAPQIIVSATLDQPHELVETARQRLTRLKPGDRGLVHCTAYRCLDIQVSPPLLDRALRIMDALIRACAARGYEFDVTPVVKPDQSARYQREPEVPSNETRVVVDGELIVVGLTELLDTERDPPPTPPKNLSSYQLDWWIREHKPPLRYIPNGRLRLEISGRWHRADWRDLRRRTVELKLDEVVAGLVAMASAIKADRVEEERRRQQQDEEERKRRKAEERARLDADGVRQVQTAMANRRLARDLRKYAALGRNLVAEAHCSITPDGSLDRLIRWAEDYADRIEPFADLRKELAGHHTKWAETEEGRKWLEEVQQAARDHERAERVRRELQDWRLARDLREYVDVSRRIVSVARCEITPDGPLDKELRWAESYAERIDPFTSLHEELAQHIADRAKTGLKASSQDALRAYRDEQREVEAMHRRVEDWQRAGLIRAYVGECAAVVAGMRVDPNEVAEVEKGRQWTLAQADRIDPIAAWKAEIERRRTAGRTCPPTSQPEEPRGD